MSRFFDDLHAQLQTAVDAQIAAQTRSARGRRRSWRSSITELPVIAAILTSIAVAAVALTLIRPAAHPSTRSSPPTPPATQPQPGLPAQPSRREQREETYLYRAQNTAFKRDSACPPGNFFQAKPTLSQGSPSRGLLAILGALRRPATAADKLPARITYNPYQRNPTGTLPSVRDIYVRYIRYARHRDGANFYLVPAGNVNPQQPVPERCYAEQQRALQLELPRIPAGLRAGTLALEPRFLTQMHQNVIPYPGVCLLGLNGTGNGGGGCGLATSITDIEQGTPIESDAPAGVPIVEGIAPDGVRSITFYYPGRYPGHPLTALVINNVFILHDPGDRLPNAGFPTTMVWHAANGAVIKTIHRR